MYTGLGVASRGTNIQINSTQLNCALFIADTYYIENVTIEYKIIGTHATLESYRLYSSTIFSTYPHRYFLPRQFLLSALMVSSLLPVVSPLISVYNGSDNRLSYITGVLIPNQCSNYGGRGVLDIGKICWPPRYIWF